jgi:acyl-CoA dehydrogenase
LNAPSARGAATLTTSQTKSPHVEAAAKIAVEVAAPNATSVDREARFPREAIEAMKQARLLSAFVPKEMGGAGCGMLELSAMCEALAQGCSSAAMVFAMHQIQVACLVRHHGGSQYVKKYLRDLVDKQNLIASVTSEVVFLLYMRTSV